MDKEDVVYTYNGILFSQEKEGNPTICDNMDGLEGIMLSEISQRKKYCKMSTYMWNLKNQTCKSK